MMAMLNRPAIVSAAAIKAQPVEGVNRAINPAINAAVRTTHGTNIFDVIDVMSWFPPLELFFYSYQGCISFIRIDSLTFVFYCFFFGVSFG
jgi:hypothetical protein